MAKTFSVAYADTPEGFQKRVYAELEAQSIAIGAALALAAKSSEQGDDRALNILQVLIAELDKNEGVFSHDQRDKLHAQTHLSNIFTEARKILATKFPSSTKNRPTE
ncbi:hypothetical protein NIZ92_11560 [Alcaligenes sp. 1735tsa3]|uniref:hypothetical protein n=1 Tax=Alcaligenes sp. 1735tsa3 TaxID=2953809 RepID=UPI0020A72FFA|nr:hypothetical protein [Alcaligenes sp. 1735tsa3]USY23959.1 hypothetical protein NIZ92_11560 [Alcaligenes sp. 1735tsa3]